MNELPSVVNCRWARPTVRLPYPYWLNAEELPWACLRDPEPHLLEDAERCRDCPRWDPRHLTLTDRRVP
jgi:hypothetical protein